MTGSGKIRGGWALNLGFENDLDPICEKFGCGSDSVRLSLADLRCSGQFRAILRRGLRCAYRMMSARNPLARHLRRIRDFLTSSICTEVAVILLCFPDYFLAF